MCLYCENNKALPSSIVYTNSLQERITEDEADIIYQTQQSLHVNVYDSSQEQSLRISSDDIVQMLRRYSQKEDYDGKSGSSLNITVKIPIEYCPMCGKKLEGKKRELSIDEMVFKRIFGE